MTCRGAYAETYRIVQRREIALMIDVTASTELLKVQRVIDRVEHIYGILYSSKKFLSEADRKYQHFEQQSNPIRPLPVPIGRESLFFLMFSFSVFGFVRKLKPNREINMK